MTIQSSGRAALILAAGLWFGYAGLLPGAASAATHHLKKHAHQTASDEVAKAAPVQKPVDDNNSAQPASSSDMPASVANANAQWPATSTTTGNAATVFDSAAAPQTAVGSPAGAQAAAEAPVAASDQLSDADRGLREAQPVVPPVAVASADASPAVAANASAVENGDNGTWDKTSLIGKIFVGCGALLTLASAARMFMA